MGAGNRCQPRVFEGFPFRRVELGDHLHRRSGLRPLHHPERCLLLRLLRWLRCYAAHHARRAYARTPVLPAFYLEGPYDEEHTDGTNVNPHATQPVRRFQWWGWLGSIGGHIAGNGYVWPFRDELWKQHLDTRGAKDMAILNAFVVSLPWHALVPSALGGQRELIVKDGSHERAPAYIAAAALDGSLLVPDTPPDRSGGFTVDLTVMRGPARARWFDPTSGAYRAAGNALSGTHRFTTPGKNAAGDRDWVLVLDAPAPAY
jgi:hypothetical protein